MKKFIMIVATIIALSACNNTPKQTITTDTDTTTVIETVDTTAVDTTTVDYSIKLNN